MVTATKFSQSATSGIIEFNNPKEWIKETYNQPSHCYGMDSLLKSGTYKYMGWSYDFRSYLKCYWVKVLHYGIVQYYAPNKTLLRKVLGSHNVIKIIEVS